MEYLIIVLLVWVAYSSGKGFSRLKENEMFTIKVISTIHSCEYYDYGTAAKVFSDVPDLGYWSPLKSVSDRYKFRTRVPPIIGAYFGFAGLDQPIQYIEITNIEHPSHEHPRYICYLKTKHIPYRAFDDYIKKRYDNEDIEIHNAVDNNEAINLLNSISR
jgi:hypothetical protein